MSKIGSKLALWRLQPTSKGHESANMKHQVQNYSRFARDTVYELPDGRRLVSAFDRPAKVIDAEGTEISPSPSELAALLAVAGMAFPKKAANGKRLFRLHTKDDWTVAA